MKVCEICEKVEACVEVKHYEDGALRELCLCEACAQQHGLHLPPNLADLLLETTLQAVAATPVDPVGAEVEVQGRCPSCGMRVADFRKSGRVGCSDCYEALGDVLEPMLMGMHRSLVYKGAVPGRAVGDTGALEQALQEAVAQEDYEAAARLRDRLRAAHDGDGLAGKQREFWFDESE